MNDSFTTGFREASLDLNKSYVLFEKSLENSNVFSNLLMKSRRVVCNF